MNGASKFQNGSLTLLKNKTAPATWYFRFYEERDGRRVYRNQRIGTIQQLRTRRDAEKAVLNLRVRVNSEIRSPETVSELINHYKKHELTETGNKRSSTRRGYETLLGLYVEPRWGVLRLDNVKTVQVEQWLRSLLYSPSTKSKIRNVMSAVFAHGKRYEFISTNPILGVRCSAKRLREPDVLTPDEFNRLVKELPLRERVMVLLAGTTGLRRSELIALVWQDIDFETLQIQVKRSCVYGQVGETKTPASARPVPLHPTVAGELGEWRKVSLYRAPSDFLFPSVRNHGRVPVWPDILLKKVIRPAVERAGITGKTVGWHTFRHSLGTNLRFLGIDIKTAQELLRHANSRITLDLYTQAVSTEKRKANAKVVDMLLSASPKPQHHRAPSELQKEEVLSVGC
jgi:integrase